MNRGMLFSFYSDGKFTYLIPSEIQEAYRQLPFNEFLEARGRCQVVNQYVNACMSLYGVCSNGTVYEIYLSHNLSTKPLTPEEFARITGLLMSAHQTWYWEDGNLISEGVGDEEELEELLLGSENKPYYIPDKEEFLKYADDFYYEWTPQLESLKSNLIRIFHKDAKLIEDLVDDIQLACSMEASIDEVMYEFERRKLQIHTRAQLESIVKLIIDVKNNTRLWVNRGYTPVELRQLHGEQLAAAASGKVGRNDPCPCGSGKKYKKCCM
jgi:uncharacterized protein YchJ